MALRRILADPEITCVIMESMPSPREYLFLEENCLAVLMRLGREARRAADVGFMIHSCDHWNGVPDVRAPGSVVWDDIDEDLLWQIFEKSRPPIFSFYSVRCSLVPEGIWYDPVMSERFWQRVIEYKRSFGS